MALRITITDENTEVVDHLVVYQDGSDSEGAAKIRALIEENFEVEPEEADVENDEFLCSSCHKAHDIDESVKLFGSFYVCEECAEALEERATDIIEEFKKKHAPQVPGQD